MEKCPSTPAPRHPPRDFVCVSTCRHPESGRRLGTVEVEVDGTFGVRQFCETTQGSEW